jgi:DNA polymerase-3 subunit gamma/tau
MEMQEGRSIDFIEMDAASHTGVDNVREAIVEHVRFAPAGKKHKIYVLDEAHMLSTSAWNALLKTLEEPPPYAIFILATTELHKVPATIVSRCQRFDFKRIPDGPLADRVRRLAKDEGFKIDDDVITTVVKNADGCVRDAETLLDQLFALGEKKITKDVASLVIPVSRIPVAAHLLATCADRLLGPALAEVALLEEEGIPLLPLFDDLIRTIRFTLLASDDAKTKEKLDKGDEGEKIIATLVGRFSPAELADMALLFMERRRDAKQGIDPRFALELAVTAIALGVLPNGPGESKEGTITAMNTAPAIVSQVTPPLSFQRSPHDKPVHMQTGSGNPSVSILERRVDPEDDKGAKVDLALVQRKWQAIVRAVGEKNPSLTFILTISRPEAVTGNTVVIRFQYPFHRDKIVREAKNKYVVEDVMREILGASVNIDAVVGEDPIVAEKRSDDMTTNILRAFGGQVVDETP